MLHLYPDDALDQLEFNKIRKLLYDKCTTDEANKRVVDLAFQINPEKLRFTLEQTKEYKNTFFSDQPFPSTTVDNLERELKLLILPGSSLQTEDLAAIRFLTEQIESVFKWFKGKGELFPNLFTPLKKVVYEKEIEKIISEVLDPKNQIRQDASPELERIGRELREQRQTVVRVFENDIRRYSKKGYLSDIGSSFLNGRKCLAVLSENKRIVRGIFHGESDTGKTTFIEPEDTIELNNEIARLSHLEQKEIKRILKETTLKLSPFQPQLNQYYRLCGLFDFIRAKARLAQSMDAVCPKIVNEAHIHLIKARHPLLLLKNQQEGKETIPLDLKLDEQNRILMISGPNAGGKTVAMKTIGLLQLMTQAGLLIPAESESVIGVFKQVMVHIGDTQSIENELSTYSAHLKHMNYFLRFAKGKTLFLIDELGSGSDPYLGGTFAEAIVEELVRKHAFGVVTTHYLNLKIMAEKTRGMLNGAMLFDEKHLEPLFQLKLGKPGSSYTFAIAKRSGLPEKIIDRARKLTDQNHIRLDHLLLEAEKQNLENQKLKERLEKELAEALNNKTKYDQLAQKEEHRQKMAELKLQNKIKQDELDYLKETERKLKQIVQEWKRADDKKKVIRDAEKLFFKKKLIKQNEKAAKEARKKYKMIRKLPEIGDLVKSKVNNQVGKLEEIKNDKGIVRIGNLPFTVSLNEWEVVEERQVETPSNNTGKKSE